MCSLSTKWFFNYLIPAGIRISESWFLSKEENWSTRRKTSRSEGEKQQQTPYQHMVSTLGFEPGHIYGKRVLSPLRHACFQMCKITAISRTQSLWKGIRFLIPKTDYRQMCLRVTTDHSLSIPSPSVSSNKKLIAFISLYKTFSIVSHHFYHVWYHSVQYEIDGKLDFILWPESLTFSFMAIWAFHQFHIGWNGVILVIG